MAEKKKPTIASLKRKLARANAELRYARQDAMHQHALVARGVAAYSELTEEHARLEHEHDALKNCGTPPRITGLLEANNALVERARKAEVEAEALRARLRRAADLGPLDINRWRHKVRGTVYKIIGIARVQCPEDAPLRDDETVLLYQDVDSSTLSVRREAEFHDGRFERLAEIVIAAAPTGCADDCAHPSHRVDEQRG